jgi:hypothetical protein
VNELNLKSIDSNTTSHSGYGAGSGEVIREEYECPCGSGEVIYEKDDIPGFKDTSIWCTCKDCVGKYEFGRGTAVEKSNV